MAMSDGLLEGVEELPQLSQMELVNLKENRRPEDPYNILLDNTMEDNWNDIWPLHTENSLLNDALEELKSSADSPIGTDLVGSPLTPQFPMSALDETLGDFMNIEEFFAKMEDNGKGKEFEPACSPNDNPQILFEENFVDCTVTGQDSIDNTTLDIQDMFPNLVMQTEEAETVVTSEQFIVQNVVLPTTSSANNLNTANCLELLMLESGIVMKSDDEQSEVVVSLGSKRKSTEESSPHSTKSPRTSESDFDESSSLYSPSISSPEDKVTERRKKNNIASKMARANRKARHEELFKREQHLKDENSRLRIEVEKMTEEAAVLRKILIEKLAGKSGGCNFGCN